MARGSGGSVALGGTAIEVGLNAAIVAVENVTPLILVVEACRDGRDSLPFGPFDPLGHRTLEIGLRAWVEAQTDLKLGYVEQLYTFGDRGRHARAFGDAIRASCRSATSR